MEERGNGTWAVIAGRVAAAYLPPQINHHELARALGLMTISHTIMGDLNACGGSPKRRLEKFIETEQLDDIGREDHTHEWGNHRCRIDRVLTRGRGKPWVFRGGWECNSDHTIVATKVSAEAAIVENVQTGWHKVREYLEGEEEYPEGPTQWVMVGDPYKKLRQLSKSWTRVVKIHSRSKGCWKKEWKPLRKKARKSKEAREEFHEEIRKAKRQMWSQWVEEGKSVWDIARNPFTLKTNCTRIEDEEGEVQPKTVTWRQPLSNIISSRRRGKGKKKRKRKD